MPWLLALCQLSLAIQHPPARCLCAPVVVACCHLPQSKPSLGSFTFWLRLTKIFVLLTSCQWRNEYGIDNTCTVQEIIPIIFSKDLSTLILQSIIDVWVWWRWILFVMYSVSRCNRVSEMRQHVFCLNRKWGFQSKKGTPFAGTFGRGNREKEVRNQRKRTSPLWMALEKK